jgi:hypothetical protein
MNRKCQALCCPLLGILSLCAAQSGTQGATPPEKEKVPVMDGGAGPCSLDLTVINADAKPVYAATLKVHIAYGFAGVRRLDLEAGTNSEGRVKFTGLPSRVHRAPLEFRASKEELTGMATYDPTTECQGRREIRLAKQDPGETH